MDDFFDSHNDSKQSKLRILYDELSISSDYKGGIELPIEPVLNTKKVIIHVPEKPKSENSLF